MSAPERDQLELELRQIPGVVVVGFADGLERIELGLADGADPEAVRAEAARIVRGHVDGDVRIEVLDRRPAPGAEPAGSRMRVQLIAVTPEGSGDRLQVHLAHRGRRVAVACRAGDRVGAAHAVIEGLRELGLPVPYEPAAVHILSEDLGDGTLVVLRHRHLGGVRRGVAAGARVEESVARAVLNGLNRHLQPDPRAVARAAALVDLREG